MIKRLYSLFLICVCISTNAQKLHFDNFTTKNGLLSDEVYNLHQDNNGYIWLFTNYGSMKYNGKSFELVLKNLPLTESVIYCIYENQIGQKWVVNSNAKIYEVINDSAFIIKNIEATSTSLKKDGRVIYQIYLDDSLNIYAATKNDTYKFLKKDNYRPVNLSHQMQQKTPEFYVLEFKRAIISSWNMCEHNKIKFNLNDSALNTHLFYNFKLKEKLTINHTIGRYMPKYIKRFNGAIYITCYSKIIKLQGNQVVKEIPLNNYILNFTKDKNNHLWVACYNNGLFELDENDSIINHYFAKKTVNSVLIDSNNGLWISTEGSGIFYCKNLKEFHYDNTEALSVPIAYIKKIDDKLFVANKNGIVFLEAKESFTKIHNEEALLDNEPFDITKYNTDYVLDFRHNLKLLKIHGSTFELSNFCSPFSSRNIISLGGNTLLCARSNKVVMLSQNKIVKEIPIDFRTFYCAHRDGIIYIATEKGIYIIKNNAPVIPNYLLPSRDAVVIKIIKDNLNNLWFCTRGSGLFKLTVSNQLKQYTIANNLPSNFVNDVSFNNDNSILLSTNKGLFLSESANPQITKWTELYAEEVKSAVPYNDNVYLATKNGLIKMTSQHKKEVGSIYFNVASIAVNEIKTNQQQLQTLTYNQNNITFNVDVISYSNSIPNVLYTLSGAKTEQGISSTQQFILKNLAPGSYTLTMALVTKEYQVKPFIIPFTIVPPFWQTWWARVIVALIIIGLIWYYIKFRERKVVSEKQKLEKIVVERTTEAVNQKNEAEKQKVIADQQKNIVEKKHKEITDSINYAERIQRSFLASKILLDQNLANYFIIFKPKDIVSGDFYWADTLPNGNFILATADSTGHGVPGAIMSILNITSLEKAVEHLTNPAELLNHTRQTIINRLKRDGSEEGGKDGMDCSIIVFDFISPAKDAIHRAGDVVATIQIAVAHNPVWIIRLMSDESIVMSSINDTNHSSLNSNHYTIIEIKPDKMPVGKHDKDQEPFTLHTIDVKKGDIIYTLTDGFSDQFGGSKGKKYMSNNLKELLMVNAHLPMNEQKTIIENAFNAWIGNYDQVDDVTLIGIKI